MSNDISFLEASRPNVSEMAKLSLAPQSTDCPNQKLTAEKKAESVVLNALDLKPELRRCISDEAWILVEPLLREEGEMEMGYYSRRSALNSILFVAIGGVSSYLLPESPSFSTRRVACEYFNFWQKDKSFSKALSFLARKPQGSSQLYCENLLTRFNTASGRRDRRDKGGGPIPIEMLSIGRLRPDFQGINDEEWSLVEPLLGRINKIKDFRRSVLNSIFLIFIDQVPPDEISVSRDFASRFLARKYFYLWRENGTFEKILNQLIKVTQGSLQSDYMKLLEQPVVLPALIQTLSPEDRACMSISTEKISNPDQNRPFLSETNSCFLSKMVTGKEPKPKLRCINDEARGFIEPLTSSSSLTGKVSANSLKLQDLPKEILVQIISLFPAFPGSLERAERSLIAMSRVNRKFRALICNDIRVSVKFIEKSLKVHGSLGKLVSFRSDAFHNGDKLYRSFLNTHGK